MPLFTPRTWARVPFGASFTSHAHVHACESAHAFMFIPTRFCLLFLPKCCKCDIITVDDRLLRKRSKETAYLANKPQKPYQKIPRFSSLYTQDTRRKLRDASIIDIMPPTIETTFSDEFRMSIWVNQYVPQRHDYMDTADRGTHKNDCILRDWTKQDSLLHGETLSWNGTGQISPWTCLLKLWFHKMFWHRVSRKIKKQYLLAFHDVNSQSFTFKLLVKPVLHRFTK